MYSQTSKGKMHLAICLAISLSIRIDLSTFLFIYIYLSVYPSIRPSNKYIYVVPKSRNCRFRVTGNGFAIPRNWQTTADSAKWVVICRICVRASQTCLFHGTGS